MKRLLVCGVLFSLIGSPASFAKKNPSLQSAFPRNSFLPPNDLHLQDNTESLSTMTEEDFNKIANDIVDKYQPLAKLHGGVLSTNNAWEDSTVNAYANRDGSSWQINMFGGLARRKEITADGFALVVCHELGHHFGGFSFKGSEWAANEGQADYFATQSCARQVWKGQDSVNASFKDTLSDFEKQKCDAVWTNAPDQNLCYRVVAGSQSLANLLSALRKDKKVPSSETPDSKVVRRTDDAHPQAQCRMDTYFRGSLCTVEFDPKVIPGLENPRGQQSSSAEADAYKYSCSRKDQPDAARPACWFKSGMKSATDSSDTPDE